MTRALLIAIRTALATLTNASVLEQTRTALAVMTPSTVASNDFLTLTDFLRDQGVETDTKIVGDAVDALFPNGFDAGVEKELPDWACQPGSGLVLFK